MFAGMVLGLGRIPVIGPPVAHLARSGSSSSAENTLADFKISFAHDSILAQRTSRNPLRLNLNGPRLWSSRYESRAVFFSVCLFRLAA
jgi:hypothetical protein